MPTIRRIYAVVSTSNVSTADTRAQDWDLAGGGVDTFAGGARLSNDGGATLTHRAMNCLDNPAEGSIIDRAILWDAFSNTPLLVVYGCDDRLGEGTVYVRDAGSWVEVASGHLAAVAKVEEGLTTYTTESL